MIFSSLALRRLSYKGISFCQHQKKTLTTASILVDLIKANNVSPNVENSSRGISFTSPEADFRFLPSSQNDYTRDDFQREKYTSIDYVSYSSPESDFKFFSTSNISPEYQGHKFTSADNVSFASPESDFLLRQRMNGVIQMTTHPLTKQIYPLHRQNQITDFFLPLALLQLNFSRPLVRIIINSFLRRIDYVFQ